jgi:hypothetical protein
LLYLAIGVFMRIDGPPVHSTGRRCGNRSSRMIFAGRRLQNSQDCRSPYYDHRPVGWMMARLTSDCDSDFVDVAVDAVGLPSGAACCCLELQ